MALDVSMILRLVDKVTAPAKQATSAIKKLNTTADQVNGSGVAAAAGIAKVAVAAKKLDEKPVSRLSQAWRKFSILARRPSLLVVRTKADPKALAAWKAGVVGSAKRTGILAGAALGAGLFEIPALAAAIAAPVMRAGMKFDTEFAARVGGATEKLSAIWSGFLVKIGQAGVFDFIGDKLEQLTGWLQTLEKNGTLDAWAKSIGEWATGVGKATEGVDWSGLISDVVSIATTIGDVGSAIASIGGGGLGGLFNVGVAAMIAKVTFSLGGLAGALGVVSIAGAPLWLVVGVIAAIAAGAYLVYKNWDSISAWFAEKWGAVKAVFVEAGTNIVASLTSMWERAKGAFLSGVNAIWNMLPSWMRGIFNGATFGIRVAANLLGGQGLAQAGRNAGRASGLIPGSGAASIFPQRPRPAVGKQSMQLDNRLQVAISAPPGMKATVTGQQTAPGTRLSVRRDVNRGFAMPDSRRAAA